MKKVITINLSTSDIQQEVINNLTQLDVTGPSIEQIIREVFAEEVGSEEFIFVIEEIVVKLQKEIGDYFTTTYKVVDIDNIQLMVWIFDDGNKI